MKDMSGSAGRWIARVAGAVAVASLAACGGGGGSDAVPQGTLQMSLTDAPACYDSVVVTVTKVRVHKAGAAENGADAWEEIIPPNGPVQVDLLNLTNGALQELGAAQVDAVEYDQVRLVLAENAGQPWANYVTLPGGGGDRELKTPSAQQSGLKIKAGFSVAADATTDMLLDFDACKSVVVAGNSGQYILKPVVRFSGKPAGSISGYVTTTMTLSATSVSAQKDGEVLRSTTPDANGQFKLAYLEPGTYTVVITSPERATGVISSVPVGTVTTTVNGTASYIVLPSSPMGTVSGVVTAGSALETAATVTASQAVSGGTIEVLRQPVDLDLATYTMQLPTADPVRAPYAAGGLTFAADATAGGKYQLTATAPGRAPLSQTVTPPATVDFKY